MKFVHLHNHTHYSLLDGLPKIDEFINKAKELNYEAIAITDHGNLYGAIEFYTKAKKAGIKPIIGVEAYLAPRTRFDKVPKIDSKNSHILLLSKNIDGYKNLLKLVSKAHIEGYYYKPRIDIDLLKEYNNGLIALSGCLAGRINRLLLQNNFEEAEKFADQMREIFGEDFYLEIGSHHGIEESKKVFPRLIEFSKKTKIPLAATNDIHYLHKDDRDVHDVFLAIQTRKKTDDGERLSMNTDFFDLAHEDELVERFKEAPSAIENTVKIADACNLELKLRETKMPPFEVPAGETHNSYLQKLCEKGLGERGLKENKEAKDRLEYELKVITQAGFSPYMLVMYDISNFAKENNIRGNTRGSAAGSFVSFVLGITKINPLEYGLLFERFLNLERIAPPDIDMDFSDTRRDELFEYLKKRYGENKVAQIVTFGTMAARAAIRDAGRAMQLPYNFCDKIAKLIPASYTLEKALEFVPELNEMYSKNADAKRLINIAKKLEGTVRHASVHACGVVITPTEITDYAPIQPSPQDDSKIITQYDMYAIEELGLLKIDLLGLRTLSEIETTEDIIRERYNVSVEIKDSDKKIYDLLSRGETVGVFQLEGGGMKDWLVKLKPSRIEDIIAMVALYRPGPMELIPQYIKRKHKLEKSEYLHPKLEPILKNTHGILIYQEQLLQIARELAGFSWGEADVLRKAVGKKITKLLEEQKQKMINGMVRNKIDIRTAEKIWNWFEPFARYGFNLSHAACYAFVAYHTAYLKTHYPIEFLTAVFIHEGQDTERAKELIEEAKRMKFRVLPPDINESDVNFSITDNSTIRFGLGAIKNVGIKLVENLVAEREKNGKFSTIGNFLKRINHKDLNKKSIESLVKAGALDSVVERDLLLGNLDYLLEFQQKQRNSVFQSQRLFGTSEEIILKEYKVISIEEKLKWEKELLGIYISGHPFKRIYEKMNSKIKKIEEIKKFKELNRTRIGGVISNTKRIMTKRNEPMMTLELEDLSDSVKVIFFPKSYQKAGGYLQEGKTVLITGNYDPLRGEMIGEEIVEIK